MEQPLLNTANSLCMQLVLSTDVMPARGRLQGVDFIQNMSNSSKNANDVQLLPYTCDLRLCNVQHAWSFTTNIAKKLLLWVSLALCDCVCRHFPVHRNNRLEVDLPHNKLSLEPTAGQSTAMAWPFNPPCGLQRP